MFQVIGNLAHLKQLQSDDFLLKGGIEAIIKNLENVDDKKLEKEESDDDEEEITEI